MTPLPIPSASTTPAPRCARCGLKLPPLRRPSCRWCDRLNIPPPGGPAWRRWTRGLSRTIRRRCDDAGLWQHQIAASKALLFDDGAVPAEVTELLADIAVLPCSYGRYAVVLERALNQVGLSMRLPRERVLMRVAMPRLRVEVVDGGEAGEDEAAAEHEAAAVEEARARR